MQQARVILPFIILACGGVPAPARAQDARSAGSATPLAAVHEHVVEDPVPSVTVLDGCVTVHDVWKPQVLALHRTAARSDARVAAFEKSVRQPYEELWRSYVGNRDVFARWVRDRLQVEQDVRRALPVELNLAELIAATTSGMMSYTGRSGCGEWYAVFGPGQTDMGSLGNNRIVVDFLGLSAGTRADSILLTLAHEVNHLMFGARRDRDPQAGTVLYRMIDEGLAAYVAHHYSGPVGSPARALSWTEEELEWALRHERELWTMLQRYLYATHPDVFDAFFMYDQQVRPGAPGKIGYFLGYRIIAAYVRRHGPDSWRDLYDMNVADILDASRVTVHFWAN